MPIAGRLIPAHQIAYAAWKAGLPEDQLVTAVAVAYGECEGYDRSYNPNPSTNDKSYGLWQINMLGNLMAVRLKQYKITRPEELFDIEVNARAMAMIYKESVAAGYNGWRPWGAYTNGRYKKAGRWETAQAGVALLKRRIAESGDRLHLYGEDDCDRI